MTSSPTISSSTFDNNDEEKYETIKFESKTADEYQDGYYYEEDESRPSSSGTMDGHISSRPSTAATSRPNSRQKDRPYSASSVDSIRPLEDNTYQDHYNDQDAYHYSDLPDSRGDSRGGIYSRGDSYDSSRGNSRGNSRGDSRGYNYGYGDIRGDSRETMGTSSSEMGMGRPPSGRSSIGFFSRPGTMSGSRPGTMGTIGTMETLDSSAHNNGGGNTSSKVDIDNRDGTDDKSGVDAFPIQETNSSSSSSSPSSSSSSSSSSETKHQKTEEKEEKEGNTESAFVDPSGHFVTDDFLEALMKSRYLDSNVARTQVDGIREQVRIKKEAEQRARLARQDGTGNENGVQLLRSNAELDGSIENVFPSQDFMLAKAGVVRRAMISVARHLGCERDNTLLVRSSCAEDNVDIFRSTDWLTFAGPRGYNLGGLGGLPSGGIRGMMASARLLGNCEDPRILLEYGPIIGISEYGEIGEILRTDKRGSLYQRNACPTFTQKIYDELLQVHNDDLTSITSANDAKTRAEKYGASAIKLQETSTLLGKDMIQPVELIKSLMPESIVETWARRGRKESLVIEMYKEIRAQVMEIIKTFQKLGGNHPRDKYSELVRMSTIPIVSIGVIRVCTQIEFDNRVIPMDCEYHRKGRKSKSYLSELERSIDEFWDVDSTDPEDEDSEDDEAPPIEGRI